MTPFSWPALAGGARPSALRCERAVWGKAHAARTDFRWLAQSAGFDQPPAGGLLAELNLGTEDRPQRAVAWRILPGERRCYAVVGYRSRATDLAGRQGFLEKQVLEWRLPADVPAAWGATFLLRYVEQLDDSIWWERRAELAEDDHRLLEIAPLELADCDEAPFLAAVESGLLAVREAADEATLTRFYLDLLAGRRPAALFAATRPLPATGLAALLLPLSRDLADRLSLAAWVPSQRPALDDLGRRWDALVTSDQPPAAAESPDREELQFSARTMAARLLGDSSPFPVELPEPLSELFPGLDSIGGPEPVAVDPARRYRPPQRGSGAPGAPSPTADAAGGPHALRPPPPDASAILSRLRDFAADPQWRWLDPQQLPQLWQVDVEPLKGGDAEQARELLASWISELEAHPPEHAHREQWEVKVDVLRSAALVLAPAAATLQRVGLPTGKRVPALLFALALDDRVRGQLLLLGDDGLRRAVDQSLACLPSPWRSRVESWLRAWERSRSNAPRVTEILSKSLADHGKGNSSSTSSSSASVPAW